jgi:hypothetical protein
MAKQTFTTGQVLSAAQMTSLQQTAMGGGSATAKTASYVLVAADAGTTVIMNAAGSTTITVNTGLFAAGDTVLIQNIGAGTTTVTAGTATVNTAGSLTLSQYEGGILYFTATGAAVFHDFVQASGATSDTWTLLSTTTLSGLSTITVSSLTSSKLIVWLVGGQNSSGGSDIRVRPNSSTTTSNYNQNISGTSGGSYFGTLSYIYAGASDNTGANSNFWLNLENCTSTTSMKPFRGNGNSASQGVSVNYNGAFMSTSAITSMNVFPSSGTWTAGTLYIYGA